MAFPSADFSLSEWKANKSLVSLSDGDRYLLQEDLRVSRYLWPHTCSRESDDYIPHTNYWKDGNFLWINENKKILSLFESRM